MALFKILKGSSTNLSKQSMTEGYCYFTPDTGMFYIDYKDDSGSLKRVALNAEQANKLTVTSGGTTTTLKAVVDNADLSNSDEKIPTSKAVMK